LLPFVDTLKSDHRTSAAMSALAAMEHKAWILAD
jgi:hypothetical protein